MSNYARKAKKKNIVKDKAPRCCGRHMIMNSYGLYQCRKCGRQVFPISNAPADEVIANEMPEATTPMTSEIAPDTSVTAE